MRNWLAVLVATALIACVTGTTTPGVSRCFTTFYGIGWSTQCEQGPPWKPVATTQPQPIGMPVTDWWCVVRGDGIGVCMRDERACEAFRAPTSGSDDEPQPCVHQPIAWCAGDNCFTAKSGCDAFEARLGRAAQPCEQR